MSQNTTSNDFLYAAGRAAVVDRVRRRQPRMVGHHAFNELAPARRQLTQQPLALLGRLGKLWRWWQVGELLLEFGFR